MTTTTSSIATLSPMASVCSVTDFISFHASHLDLVDRFTTFQADQKRFFEQLAFNISSHQQLIRQLENQRKGIHCVVKTKKKRMC
jgi:hypothetical protein